MEVYVRVDVMVLPLVDHNSYILSDDQLSFKPIMVNLKDFESVDNAVNSIIKKYLHISPGWLEKSIVDIVKDEDDLYICYCTYINSSDNIKLGSLLNCTVLQDKIAIKSWRHNVQTI